MNTTFLNTATFIGIDAHPTQHTAVAINRFEDEKGLLTFENSSIGITTFLAWLPTIEADAQKMIIGVEGGGNRKLNHALYLAALLQLRWNLKAKEYFAKKLKEGKTMKHALKCLMKRTACIVYGMLKNGEEYRG